MHKRVTFSIKYTSITLHNLTSCLETIPRGILIEVDCGPKLLSLTITSGNMVLLKESL